MPLGMTPYDCDRNTGICGGGFGGGSPAATARNRYGWPVGYDWLAVNVPMFTPYSGGVVREVPDGATTLTLDPNARPLSATQNPDGTLTISHQTPPMAGSQQTVGGNQQAAGTPNWLLPVLIVIAAIVMSR